MGFEGVFIARTCFLDVTGLLLDIQFSEKVKIVYDQIMDQSLKKTPNTKAEYKNLIWGSVLDGSFQPKG